MGLSFKVNGTVIKSPDDITFSSYKLSKSGRVASGDMTMDIIAIKRKFILKYNSISSIELQPIVTVANSFNAFFTLTYVEDNQEKTAVVYAGDLDKDLARYGSKWYYKDFEIHFIEK